MNYVMFCAGSRVRIARTQPPLYSINKQKSSTTTNVVRFTYHTIYITKENKEKEKKSNTTEIERKDEHDTNRKDVRS